MGAGPLAAPLRSKLFERRGNEHFQVSCASMQGSRAAMEDSHILQVNMDTNPEVAIFGVFDGHAGEYPPFPPPSFLLLLCPPQFVDRVKSKRDGQNPNGAKQSDHLWPHVPFGDEPRTRISHTPPPYTHASLSLPQSHTIPITKLERPKQNKNTTQATRHPVIYQNI